MDGKITVLVADDHPAVLEAVASYLQHQGVDVVGRAQDGEEALELIARRLPQVAVVDVRMPKLGGIELARRLRGQSETQVLLFSGYGDRALLLEALDAGVQGFVLKEAPLEDLLRGVRALAAGEG